MRLQTLRLKNFKGVRSFTLEANGAKINVHADNGVGKTTLFDAFTWVLFGKDSLGRADFEIKTLDEAGQPLSKLDHEVELTMDLGDNQLTLRKVFAERWTKKRGSARAEFTGHTTDHFLDGVPVAKKEYDARVAQIAPEDVFRLLTDPAAFNALHWQKRRALLLEVCGDVSDEDVLASNEELVDLPGILDGRALADHRKVVESRRREINAQLDKLPVRIDEVTQGLPDLPGGSVKELEGKLAQLREQWQELEQERARVQAGGEIAEKQRRISEVRGELQDVETSARGQVDTMLRGAKQRLGSAQDQVDAKARDLRRLQGEREDAAKRLAELEQHRQAKREEFLAVQAREFEHPHDDENCPVCGQVLPEDQVKAAHQRALEEFNARKANELEAIRAKGHELKAECERLEHRLEDLATAIATLEGEHQQFAAAAEKATKDVERLERAAPDVSKNAQYQKLLEEKTQVEEAIEALRSGNQEALAELAARIAAVDASMADAQKALASFDQRARDEQRITELEAEEKRLTAEFEELERQLYLCEQFTRAKVNLLTDRINGKFELARFKLFDEQVNGGLAETCETTYQGVPFGSLNHGARVQVGLDIVRTLQAHYGLFPPVWVDGKESVTRLPEMSCQVICLVVSERDRKLRVETGAPKHEEVAA